jgi:hypothetical protein
VADWVGVPRVVGDGNLDLYAICGVVVGKVRNMSLVCIDVKRFPCLGIAPASWTLYKHVLIFLPTFTFS